MKKWMFLLPIILFVTSCTEDIKFNNFWRAQNYKAYVAGDGTVIVEGNLDYEKITLTAASFAVGNYVLGIDDLSKGYYINDLPEKKSEFSTDTDQGNGQITITEYNAENKTISGTFKFTAISLNEDDAEKPKITFTDGVFYKVPLTSIP
jgi:hypothetical protein